ncbi:methyltransferase domain-containing protein [Altererythrobacter sp. MF3-039]|uniref:methyltransferase domain-containing protein n=1 Tax=Altererythrobacter sp. MF3-039 TaxID=3252901 RepID=UPI00390C57AF
MAAKPPSPPQIFAKERKRAALRRAAQMGSDRFLLVEMAEDLLERLDFMRAEPKRVLLIGAEGTDLAVRLKVMGSEVVAPNPLEFDEERPWPGGFDVIANLARMDRVNDLPGALIHMRKALAPGGIAIASFLGAGSLVQLREAMLAADGERPAARMHPMIDTRAASGLMQRAGFARQVVDSQGIDVRYATLDRLVADLRAHGFTNQLTSAPPPLTRSALERARQSFRDAAHDGKTAERFEILTLTGWA